MFSYQVLVDVDMAHFVTPAEFVSSAKMCLRWRHILSPHAPIVT